MPTPSPLRILAVDDEPAILQLISAHLWPEGHSVGTAGDGGEGLRQFKKGGWDVVLTDRAMPYMDGDELAAAIKILHPETPIIMVTGSLPAAGVSELRPNIDEVVTKPFTGAILREAIGRVLAIPTPQRVQAGDGIAVTREQS